MVKNLPANAEDARDAGLIPELGRSPWSRNWQPTPVIVPEKFHGQKSLVGYSPWDRKELNMTEHIHTFCIYPYLYIYLCLWTYENLYTQNLWEPMRNSAELALELPYCRAGKLMHLITNFPFFIGESCTWVLTPWHFWLTIEGITHSTCSRNVGSCKNIWDLYSSTVLERGSYICYNFQVWVSYRWNRVENSDRAIRT